MSEVLGTCEIVSELKTVQSMEFLKDGDKRVEPKRKNID